MGALGPGPPGPLDKTALISLCAWHSTGVYLADSLRLTSEFVARRHLRSADMTTLLVPPTCRVILGDRAFPVAAARASASTDQGRLVAAVFSTADKGPSVSAVVQLTSDYCTIVF